MLIIGTFPHSIELEQALKVLEHNGISRTLILVVAMDTEPKPSFHLMSGTRSLHSKGIEIGIACATGFSVIGASMGFVCPWGPIICGLLSCFLGFSLGFGIYYLLHRRGDRRRLPKKLPEITVIVQCPENESSQVREVMWTFNALTVGRVPEPS